MILNDWNVSSKWTINPVFSFTHPIGKSNKIKFTLCNRVTLIHTEHQGNIGDNSRIDVAWECQYNNKTFIITFRENYKRLLIEIYRYILMPPSIETQCDMSISINRNDAIVDEVEICKYLIRDEKFIPYEKHWEFHKINIDVRKMGLLKWKTINKLLRLTINNTKSDAHQLHSTRYKFETQKKRKYLYKCKCKT